jgi:hypothetical protein
MRVQDLQLFLGQFTKGSDAIKNAQIYVERDGGRAPRSKVRETFSRVRDQGA